MNKVITSCDNCGMEYTIIWKEDEDLLYSIEENPEPAYCPCCAHPLDEYREDSDELYGEE